MTSATLLSFGLVGAQCCSFPTHIIASEHGSDQYITHLHGEIIFLKRHLSFLTLPMTFD